MCGAASSLWPDCRSSRATKSGPWPGSWTTTGVWKPKDSLPRSRVGALDLVARREILAARLRARLKEGQLDEAQALLDEFRRLPTQVDLARELDQQRRRVASPDRLTQERIDKLFVDAQQVLVLKPLSDELLNQLTRELSATRGPGKNL